LMASNTPHLVFDELAPRSPLPLLSIVESACSEARARGFRRVGLFGSGFTMAADFYPRVFGRVGIEVIRPVPEEQGLIHARYMDELVNGVFRPETRDLLSAIARKMRERSGIDSLVLGGTELPLILTGESVEGIPLLDTTAAHVKTAVAEMVRTS
jgi:aspartate racemase